MVKIFQIFLPIIFLVVSSAQGFVETELYAGSCSGSLKVLKGGKTIYSHKKSQKISRGGYPKHLQVLAEGCGCWRVYVGFRFNVSSSTGINPKFDFNPVSVYLGSLNRSLFRIS